MREEKDQELQARTTPVKENMRWIKTAWVTERIGYLLLGLFLLYALLGGLSHGLLSDQTLTTPDGQLTVEYEKVLRFSSESDLTLSYPKGGEKGKAITLQGNFIEDYDVEYATPHTAKMSLGKNALTLYPEPDQRSEPTTVKLTFKPNGYGLYTIDILLDGQKKMTISQYVLP